LKSIETGLEGSVPAPLSWGQRGLQGEHSFRRVEERDGWVLDWHPQHVERTLRHW